MEIPNKKYYALVSNRSFPIKLQDVREKFVSAKSIKKAEKKLLKKYRKVLIIDKYSDNLVVKK